MSQPGAGHHPMPAATALPLSRFTVLEVNDASVPLCLRLATSLAGKIAADLGATVLKIEPPGGDPVRRAAPLLPGGASALFEFLNTSKRSLVLDLASMAGRQALSGLLARSHACLFEEPASVAPLLRDGAATAIEIAAFPVEMNATGRPVSELAIFALSGLMHMVGEPARKPLKLAGHQASCATGLTAFTGLAAALAARDAGRAAVAVRVSMAEVMQWVNWKAASGAAATGTSPGREGDNSEFQVVPCLDGWVAVVYTVTQWPAVRALIGDPRLTAAKFASRAGRRQHVAELYDILRPWFAKRSRADVQREAQAGRVPFGPVFTPAELLVAEQYAARAFFADLTLAGGARVRMPHLPVLWNGCSFAPRAASPLPCREGMA